MTKQKETKMTTKSIPVIATTPTRDVWYGHTTDPDATPLVLTGARHCYRWDTTDGIGQLAVTGPGPRAQIGARVPEKRIRAVAGVMLCTDAARDAMERATWTR